MHNAFIRCGSEVWNNRTTNNILLRANNLHNVWILEQIIFQIASASYAVLSGSCNNFVIQSTPAA